MLAVCESRAGTSAFPSNIGFLARLIQWSLHAKSAGCAAPDPPRCEALVIPILAAAWAENMFMPQSLGLFFDYLLLAAEVHVQGSPALVGAREKQRTLGEWPWPWHIVIRRFRARRFLLVKVLRVSLQGELEKACPAFV